MQKRIDQLKKDGKKTALLLVANAEGEVRFVALTLQWKRGARPVRNSNEAAAP